MSLPSPTRPQVQAGRIARLGHDGRVSAIHKLPLPGPWIVMQAGLVGDEQADLKHHGGPDKALHQYPLDHHPHWRSEIGEHALFGVSGAFGENLTTISWTEATVHVGDVVRWGEVLLQVSQGRQPCWKLNARFGVTDMARRVQMTGRTGWYYRVLKPGQAAPNDKLEIIDRPQPDWPLTRLARLLYRDTRAFEELALMAGLPELSEGWRALARRRSTTRQVENWATRLNG